MLHGRNEKCEPTDSLKNKKKDLNLREIKKTKNSWKFSFFSSIQKIKSIFSKKWTNYSLFFKFLILHLKNRRKENQSIYKQYLREIVIFPSKDKETQKKKKSTKNLLLGCELPNF